MTARPVNTRREFLTGQAAAEALANVVTRAVDALDGADPSQSAMSGELVSQPASTPYQVRMGRRAMACLFEVLLNAGQYPQATAAALAALEQVDELEEQMTVYRDSSEVAEINRTAADGPVLVERRLLDLFQQALALHAQTDGAFDITAGPLSRVWGFYRRQGAVPGEEQLDAARRAVGSQWLQLDHARQTIRFLRPGMEINLGSIGKGYALDRAAEVLQEAGIADFLLHGGQSSLLAKGSRAGTTGWPVGLGNPLRPGKQWALVTLCDRAMATSGAGHQYFRHQGKRYGHILDPRSGQPAEGVYSSTVLAPTAAEADALATSFYVLGPNASIDYCLRHPQIGMLMLCPGATAGSMQIHRANVDDAEVELNDHPSAGT